MKSLPLPIKLGLIALGTLIMGCFRYAGEAAHSDAGRSAAGATERSRPAQSDPGMIVHIDPATGRIISPPKETLPGPVLQAPVEGAKKPAAELRQLPSPVPGGGVMIELDERFQTPLTATVGADGKVKLEHKRTAPGSEDRQ